jgi:membrane fusion protein, multidrug efflux system
MPTDIPSRASPKNQEAQRKGLLIAGVAAICVAGVVVVAGVASRMRATAEVKTWTSSQSIPAVDVIHPSAGGAARSLVLPGSLQAYFNAPIYSRVPGYVRLWYVDIGARVKTGQLLATIDTPELDQQIAQARADVATAQANMQLAQTTAARWTRLLAQDAVSKQETDEKTGDLAAKTAQVVAAKANLDRLMALKGFSRIVAPFDGVVTARKTDIGALVNAGAGASPNSELFDVAKIDRLRLYVRVPQVNSAEIRPGVKVELMVPELPGRSFPAALDTTAHAISDNSGTLLTELMVANPGDQLKPGAYAQVRFDIPGAGASGPQTLLLPASALLFRNQGLEAAVVDATDHVRLRRVGAGRNLGQATEITSGLAPGDRVIDNPPDSIAEGQLVRVAAPAAGRGAG